MRQQSGSCYAAMQLGTAARYAPLFAWRKVGLMIMRGSIKVLDVVAMSVFERGILQNGRAH